MSSFILILLSLLGASFITSEIRSFLVEYIRGDRVKIIQEMQYIDIVYENGFVQFNFD